MINHRLLKMSAFTLIEMLVVLSIIAILSTMIFIAQEDSDEDLVTSDALILQATLDRARSLAMSTGNAYGVAFHIENAGDGAVLKNKSILDDNKESFIGRHWYCIIGPDKEGVSGYNGYSRKSEFPPIIKSGHDGARTFVTLTEYAEIFEKCQVGPRQYLSEGVRFLALSDVDELKNYTYAAATSGGVYIRSALLPPEAPSRPWFGWYDQSTNTLYPWGGYHREIDALLGYPNTGLDYVGFDGDVSVDAGAIPYDKTLDTNVSPSEVWGRINFIYDYDASDVSNKVYEGATATYPEAVGDADKEHNTFYNTSAIKNIGPDREVLAEKKRPLVNAFWCDFMIYYLPSGAARVTYAHARSAFLRDPRNFGWMSARGRSEMGVEFKDDEVGGFHITVCRDVDPDDDADLYPQFNATTGQPHYNKFDSVEDAFESINPFVRVFVSRLTGVSELRTNEHPLLGITADDLLQNNPYPNGTDY